MPVCVFILLEDVAHVECRRLHSLKTMPICEIVPALFEQLHPLFAAVARPARANKNQMMMRSNAQRSLCERDAERLQSLRQAFDFGILFRHGVHSAFLTAGDFEQLNELGGRRLFWDFLAVNIELAC